MRKHPFFVLQANIEKALRSFLMLFSCLWSVRLLDCQPASPLGLKLFEIV